MESIIKNIKNKMNGEPDLSKEDVKELVNLFKQRNISIMALENLLNFFQKPNQTAIEVQEAAFIPPSDVMKTSNDILKQENDKLSRELNLAIDEKNKLTDQLERKERLIKWMIFAIILFGIATITAWIF